MALKGLRLEWGPAIDRKVRAGLTRVQAAILVNKMRECRATEMTLITSASARIEGFYLIRAALR